MLASKKSMLRLFDEIHSSNNKKEMKLTYYSKIQRKEKKLVSHSVGRKRGLVHRFTIDLP